MMQVEEKADWLNNCTVTLATLLQEVISYSLDGWPELAEQVRELYRKPPPPEEPEDNKEFTELVGELLLQDEANSGDLKLMKDDIDKRSRKRLLQRKHDYQRERAAAAARKRGARKKRAAMHDVTAHTPQAAQVNPVQGHLASWQSPETKAP